MKRLLFSCLSFVLFVLVSQAQTDTLRYFESYFETLGDRQQWTSIPADNNIKWTFQTGGDELNPDTAYAGDYNAFYYWSDFSPERRLLVSKPIDLSDSKKPQLTFGHAMYQSVFGTDRMALLFKAGSSAPWDTIAIFSTPVNPWTLRTFNIQDYGSKYLCPGFQFAFQGVARAGHGICIDNVVIEEKDVIARSVKNLRIHGVVQNPLPTRSVDVPVMRVDINVIGNSDPLILNSIIFTSLSTNDSIFSPAGFKLVATKDSSYRPSLKGASLKIGSPVSISGGKVTFSNINYSLTTGYNAIWLITDIKNTAPHKSTVDFKVGSGAIVIGSKTFPAVEVSPSGTNTIEESVFYDGFEGTNAWALQSDFEIDVPKGLTTYITEDPDFAYSGTKVMGTDLITDGQYKLNVNYPVPNSGSYYATTPVINLQYYTDVKLCFKKWIAFEGNDHGVIEVSNDNGTTWQKIWDSKIDALTPDNDWVNLCISEAFNAIAAHKAAVIIRFGVIYSDNNFAYAGFNIDNFAVTGNYLTNDVGILEVIKPVNDCHNPGMDSVSIVVHNYADAPSINSIPVFFSIDGSVDKRVQEYITGPIPKNGTITYKFAHPANFPAPGDYSNFIVKLVVPGDEDASNDAKNKPIYIQKSISIPDHERFETSGGYWKKYGTDPRWICKLPEGSIPSLSGNSWISSPFGNYLTNDTAYLESSCYDLVSNERLILEMRLWLDSEPLKDGAAIEYSLDEGISWSLLPAHEFSWNWNWYNGEVASLGTQGWSGINTQGWKEVKQLIPAALSSEPKVKFRVIWASDGDNTYRGMAMDDFKVYAAPSDIGIFKIDSFANRCQGLNPDEVTVAIKNMGINSLKQNDTIIVGFDFNQIHVATDTFRISADLLPGQTLKHTFSHKIDVGNPGNYNLTAYTLIEDNPWFYETNNDTLSLDFEVYPAPVTSLIDTIQTHLPDTVVLHTYYDATYDYWWNNTAGTSTYNVNKDGWQYLKVTATRGNQCSAYDSTNVELLFYDIGASALVHPVDDCGFSKHEYPIVGVKNFGTDSIAAGQKIAIFYSINSGFPVADTLELENTLHSGKVVNFTFDKGAIDLSGAGTYNFKIYTSYGGDTIAANDTITRSVVMLGRPEVSLGSDITVEALSHTLDAGSGYESYLWDNNVTTRTREVTESGSYWVQVFDNKGCDNFDTAYVRLKIRDISPGGFNTPVSACTFNASEPVSLRIYNSGTDTIASGTSIAVSYRLEEGTRVNGNTTLTQQLLPGSFVLYTFGGTVDMSNQGDFNMEATAVIAGDLRTSNDTSMVTIYRYPKPSIDFGLEETEYVEDVSLVIDAGYSPNYSYQWQDTVTTHSYTATTSGLFHVKATDTRTQCFDRDTVMVFLIYGDVGITWSDIPTDGCAGAFENVRVRVQNLGPSVIGSSAPIYVACDVNGTRVTIDTLVRSGNFNPGATLEMQLSGSIPVLSAGMSSIRMYTMYDKDKKPENDTLTIGFDALPAPEVNFGDVDGTLNVDLPHVLDAGTGHKSYLWQDNSTGQTFSVIVKGVYWVTVTGQNDCQTTKTVRINMPLGIEEYSRGVISLYPNPNHGLFNVVIDNKDQEELTVRIINNQGQLVYVRELSAQQLSGEQIDVQNLSRGVYHILIQTQKEIYQGKMVIE